MRELDRLSTADFEALATRVKTLLTPGLEAALARPRSSNELPLIAGYRSLPSWVESLRGGGAARHERGLPEFVRLLQVIEQVPRLTNGARVARSLERQLASGDADALLDQLAEAEAAELLIELANATRVEFGSANGRPDLWCQWGDSNARVPVEAKRVRHESEDQRQRHGLARELETGLRALADRSVPFKSVIIIRRRASSTRDLASILQLHRDLLQRARERNEIGQWISTGTDDGTLQVSLALLPPDPVTHAQGANTLEITPPADLPVRHQGMLNASGMSGNDGRFVSLQWRFASSIQSDYPGDALGRLRPLVARAEEQLESHSTRGIIAVKLRPLGEGWQMLGALYEADQLIRQLLETGPWRPKTPVLLFWEETVRPLEWRLQTSEEDEVSVFLEMTDFHLISHPEESDTSADTSQAPFRDVSRALMIRDPHSGALIPATEELFRRVTNFDDLPESYGYGRLELGREAETSGAAVVECARHRVGPRGTHHVIAALVIAGRRQFRIFADPDQLLIAMELVDGHVRRVASVDVHPWPREAAIPATLEWSTNEFAISVPAGPLESQRIRAISCRVRGTV